MALPNPDYVAWSEDSESVLSAFDVDATSGLNANEVLRRRRAFGPNRLAAVKKRGVFSILAAQFQSIVILLLVAAACLALAFSDFAEAAAIFGVILINTAIGFLTEWRAVRSMEALRHFARSGCVVVRDGTVTHLTAEELVPGDIVVLDAGDLVPADLRLLQAAKLAVDESTLTGESLPVTKHTESIGAATPVLDRQNMAFKGTAITRGAGRGIVVATGMRTEFGKIFQQVSEARPQRTPLEERLDALGERLAFAAIAIAVLIALAGIVVGRDLYLSIEVAIALSVAAIPEGLPIVATIALARGMWRMARRNALITRLSVVETLGATSVILTDKTGTLTENKMTVTSVLIDGSNVLVEHAHTAGAARFLADGGEVDNETAAVVDELLTIATLCNNGSLQRDSVASERGVGDPTEIALLMAASGRGLWRDDLNEQYPEVHEDPFDPDSKRMATVHSLNGDVLVAVKAAPEVLLRHCTRVRTLTGDAAMTSEHRQRWLNRVEELARHGLRTLAMASKQAPDLATNPYCELVFLGVVGLEDPPRAGVEVALDECRRAGVSVVMVTGDHAATARNIATTIGIVDAAPAPKRFVDGPQFDDLLAAGQDSQLLAASVFSRVTPEQKLQLIDLYQKHGHVVAMTGDGVNDAPALRKADIGIAMGLRGTSVAKAAASMVLQDDEFATIVSAIGHGRLIFENIRKFVVYLLSCNISEVLVVALATIAGAPLPLLPLQILFLNLVTDVFPALALGVGGRSRTLMAARPRPVEEGILTKRHWLQIAMHGAIMSITVLATMAVALRALNFDTKQAVTATFATLALAQMWHVFNMRGNVGEFFNNEITRNVWVWIALLVCLILVLAAVYMPVLNEVLELSDPGARGWALIVAASVVPLLTGPLVGWAARVLALSRSD
jgi:Ca2+-transporting ATPase